MTDDVATARRVSNAVHVARWLASQLAREKHPLTDVARQLVAALLEDPVGGCSKCGGPMPAPIGLGRPRIRCESCSPPRRKSQSPAKSTLVAVDDPPIEEVA